jgi:hypothetical protein
LFGRDRKRGKRGRLGLSKEGVSKDQTSIKQYGCCSKELLLRGRKTFHSILLFEKKWVGEGRERERERD